ncbi:MAG: alpha/beta fold hydrolase, partial [Pseudomonadales bacterium]|nr:alpha/beta fold hydrolase [Pseudomonadales bacterium]
MRRAFVNFDGRQIHYRTAGEGAPVILLHPSPLSSTMVVPVAAEIARRNRVYALDTPGYGLSDPPPYKPESLDDYLPIFASTLDALGLTSVCLYGAATGAQLAVEFARRYPERVRLLILDTAGHIDPEDCEEIVRGYFPSVRPKLDGRHLMTYWHMVRELNVFFPWSITKAANRVPRDIPPVTLMQQFLLDYLRAGTRYDWAYRPAFYNERAERAQGVTVPAVVTRWVGSIALPITDALIAAGLPANYKVLPLNASMADRARGIADYIAKHYQGDPAPALPVDAPIASRLYSKLIALRGGVLHARVHLQGAGKPMLVLHSSAASAALVEPIAQGWIGRRPVIALDLPGSGESDALLADDDISIEQYAAVVLEAMDALGIEQLDVAGRYIGALVGLEMDRQRPGSVTRLTFLGVPLLSAAERREMKAHYAPSIAPQPDGTHLIRAWYMMRDQALWFPYFKRTQSAALHSEPNVDPDYIHKRVVESMKMGDRYQLAYQAEFDYPMAERLPAAHCQVILASAPWEPLLDRLPIAQKLLPKAIVLKLPDRFGDWAR